MRDERAGETDETREDVDVLVCRKCLMRRGARSGGIELPRWLQRSLSERGLSDTVHVMPTGCLRQCPRGQVTVLVTGGDPRQGSALMTVDPLMDREKLLRLIEARARPDEELLSPEPAAPESSRDEHDERNIPS